MYNPEKIINDCIEELKTLYVIDKNRNYKYVENYEERRREIWRKMAYRRPLPSPPHKGRES
ncbi:MAG: hypothetical protein HUK07_07000 [Bacteroidaceae bacterium]|nr:hypothetical protein [Bacteroidaceae bacterium]